MSKYQWQGQPVKTEFGYCTVHPNEEKPLYWYNYECSFDYEHSFSGVALIPAIKVTQGEYSFAIANHYGIGYYKLTTGGWPNCTHFSLPVDTFSPSKELAFSIRRWDEEEYAKHEAGRRKWQRTHYPKDFNKMESLRRAITKHQ